MIRIIGTLEYTNAGHCVPFLVTGENVKKLEEGGTVVGLFEEAEYDSVTVAAPHESVFVMFSDGLTEPENVFGEQFGSRRLLEEVLRHRASAPGRIAEELIDAAEQWGGTDEQADDMTVVVARLNFERAAEEATRAARGFPLYLRFLDWGAGKLSLRQRTALVSGGSRGIGKGIAMGLAQAGARVAISYRSNKAAAQNTLREMQAAGAECFAVEADVTDAAKVQFLVDTVRRAISGGSIFW